MLEPGLAIAPAALWVWAPALTISNFLTEMLTTVGSRRLMVSDRSALASSAQAGFGAVKAANPSRMAAHADRTKEWWQRRIVGQSPQRCCVSLFYNNRPVSPYCCI